MGAMKKPGYLEMAKLGLKYSNRIYKFSKFNLDEQSNFNSRLSGFGFI
jgi:hypothetical protein